MYNYNIDTLNDDIFITGVCKLNNFLLVGCNNGSVKVYDLFQDINKKGKHNFKSNHLLLDSFLFYKTQRTIIKVYDEFVVGNACVLFLNIFKPRRLNVKNKCDIHQSNNMLYDHQAKNYKEKQKRLYFKKNYYVISACEDKLYLFLSSKIKKNNVSYQNNNNNNNINVSSSNHMRGDSLNKNKYTLFNKMKNIMDEFFVNTFNIKNKEKIEDLKESKKKNKKKNKKKEKVQKGEDRSITMFL